MIAYRDFVPRKLSDRKWVISPPSECESFDSIVAEANEWIECNHIHVLNIQAMLVPGLNDSNTSTNQGGFYIGPIERWTQIMRVWYEID